VARLWVGQGRKGIVSVDVHRLVAVLGAIENPTEMDDKRAKSAQREMTSRPSRQTCR
jgi:hypothetical protein